MDNTKQNNSIANFINHLWRISIAIAIISASYIISKGNFHIISDNYDNIPERNTITVAWEWKIFIQPDIMNLSLNVEHTTKSSQEAQQLANQDIKVIKDILKEKGIADKDIQTTFIELAPSYERQNTQNVFVWYKARQWLQVIFRDISSNQTTDVLDQITTQIDKVQVNWLIFDKEDKTEAYSNARKLAVEKAEQKAKELTQHTNVSLWRVITISESDYTYWPVSPLRNTYTQSFSEDMWSVWSDISAGQLELIRNVSITYEIVQ